MRIYYYPIIALAVLLSARPAVAQEEATQEPAVEEAVTEEVVDEEEELEEEELEEEEFDETGLDDQTYEEDDDDFVPTMEIPADTPIPFPSNI